MQAQSDKKLIYAQSSDIKSRTYLEYRKDMKQKAIAELEVLPWLSQQIKKENKQAHVEKYGGDRFIWFLRKGGITRAPDFIIKYTNKPSEYIEFQYTKEQLKAYDFKVSKIAPKDRKLKKRIPRKRIRILYIIKPLFGFAFLDPLWIVKNSKETVAPAWGNAPVFRVPEEKIKNLLKVDRKLKAVCNIIDMKLEMLNFQHNLISMEKARFSHLLQQVVDEKKILKIAPKTLSGFFRVCFILNHIEKTPTNVNIWLVYLLSFLDQKLNSKEIFELIYSLDFLYSKTELQKNEVNRMVEGIKKIYKKIQRFSRLDGSFQSDKILSPLEDTRYSLFAINILEDLTQDILFYYGKQAGLKPVKKIYQTIPLWQKTFKFIQNRG